MKTLVAGVLRESKLLSKPGFLVGVLWLTKKLGMHTCSVPRAETLVSTTRCRVAPKRKQKVQQEISFLTIIGINRFALSPGLLKNSGLSKVGVTKTWKT